MMIKPFAKKIRDYLLKITKISELIRQNEEIRSLLLQVKKNNGFILTDEEVFKIARITSEKVKTQFLHQKTFAQFKNTLCGCDVVLVATGPTIKYLDVSGFKNAKFVGLKAACFLKEPLLDYLFVQDYPSCKEYIEQIDSYEGNNCKKFFALPINDLGRNMQCFPDKFTNKDNCYLYHLDRLNRFGIREEITNEFVYDIEYSPLGTFSSVAFAAMQFILYTGTKRIFISGCDCSSGHFYNHSTNNLSVIIDKWKQFNVFLKTFYPDVEIVSINPIGLKGLFKDVYTSSYLNNHPEIKREDVETIV